MNRLIALLGSASLVAFAACSPEDPGPITGIVSPSVRGEVVASTTCAPCHGATLLGDSFDGTPTPSLVLVREYTLEQLDRLLGTGTTLDHGVNGAMVTTSVASLSADDRRALHEYLVYYWTP
jgi:cytochrome c553